MHRSLRFFSDNSEVFDQLAKELFSPDTGNHQTKNKMKGTQLSDYLAHAPFNNLPPQIAHVLWACKMFEGVFKLALWQPQFRSQPDDDVFD